MTTFFSFSSRTKIFIRFPRTLFATEDAFEFSKHQLGMIFLSVPISIDCDTNQLSVGYILHAVSDLMEEAHAWGNPEQEHMGFYALMRVWRAVMDVHGNLNAGLPS